MNIRFYIAFSLVFLSYKLKAQDFEWFSLPGNLDKNVYAFEKFNGELIVGGNFTTVDEMNVNGIVAWDGANWHPLDSGLAINTGIEPFVSDLTVLNGELYVSGNFQLHSDSSAKNVAKWDGNDWIALGQGPNLTSKNIEVFQDTIYIAGRFDSADGQIAQGIAKWNGTSWENVQEGLRYNIVNSDVFDLCVYDNKLFAVGFIDSAGPIACQDVAYWDGTNWGTINAPLLQFGIPTMMEWQGDLIFASDHFDWGNGNAVECYGWDSANFYVFSDLLNSLRITTLTSFNGELYGGGSANPYFNHNLVARWVDPEWVPVGNNLFNGAVIDLIEFQGDLYAGGSFSSSNGCNHNYIARYTELNNVSEIDIPQVQVYPNPTNSILIIQLEKELVARLSITDITGRKIFPTINESNEDFEIDLSSYPNGIYLLKVEFENGSIANERIVLSK